MSISPSRFGYCSAFSINHSLSTHYYPYPLQNRHVSTKYWLKSLEKMSFLSCFQRMDTSMIPQCATTQGVFINHRRCYWDSFHCFRFMPSNIHKVGTTKVYNKLVLRGSTSKGKVLVSEYIKLTLKDLDHFWSTCTACSFLCFSNPL